MIPNQAKYQDVLERARRRFDQAQDAEREIRAEALLDLQFLAGEQWDEKIRRDRERGPSPRPCLVFNKCLPPVTQLGNQARQNKPAVQVSAVDSAADPDTAKVIAGLIRYIEYESDAEQAYDTAFFYAAGCSFGYWMYGCACNDPMSFDQDLEVLTVSDPFSIYLDCFAKKPDKSDMKWAFVLGERMSNEDHDARFGKGRADLSAEFQAELDQLGWQDSDSKQIAEYWEVEFAKKTLRYRKDDDGTTHPVHLEDEDEAEMATWEWALDDETGEPREREVQIPTVWQYIINGAEVLEEPTKWDGSTIPIVKVTGLEVTLRGKRMIFSMTRFARDPQQLLNYYKTMEAESIALAPKPKFVGAVGQFRTKRRDWGRANVDNAAFLEYDPLAVGDKLAPEPQWRVFDPPVQALAIGAAAASDDIKASTGYFDPSLGQVKGDQSGVAIGKLQRQGDVSNYHFMDNLARAIKRGGRIKLDLIPKKYDTDREIQIIGEGQKDRVIRVNAPYTDENGKIQHHKLDRGKYACRVQQGTSYETQRDETRTLIMTLAQGNPEIWQLAADVFFENQDFIGADRLARRFKAALPPQFQDPEDGDGKDVPPQVQAKMQKQEQALQALTATNQQLMDMLKAKVLDLESKERIAEQTNRTRVQVAETVSKSASMNKLAELDHKATEHRLDLRSDLLHATLSIEDDAAGVKAEQQHEADMQKQQQQHEADLADQQQEHQTDLAGQAQDATADQAAEQRKADQASQQLTLAAKPPAKPTDKAKK